MSNIAKKGSGLPSLEMPQLPSVFGRLMPSQTPELTFNTGIIKGIFHSWKVGRMEEVSRSEANIAENRLRVTKATSEALIEALTFGDRYKNTLLKYEHERLGIAHEERLWELNEKKEEAIVAQEVYRAKTMEIEFRDAEVNLNLKFKELGIDSEDENRK